MLVEELGLWVFGFELSFPAKSRKRARVQLIRTNLCLVVVAIIITANFVEFRSLHDELVKREPVIFIEIYLPITAAGLAKRLGIFRGGLQIRS